MASFSEGKPLVSRDTVACDPRTDSVNGNASPIGHLLCRTGALHDVGMFEHEARMHIASRFVKCQMHHAVHYADPMETPAERLKAARERAGFDTAKDAALAMGISVPTYIQHENGTRGYPKDRALRYAQFFRTTPEWLQYGREIGDRTTGANLGPQLAIQGAVAAGIWRERAEYPEDEWEAFTGAASINAPAAQRFGLRVEGDSMDLLYPPGTILECVRYWGDAPIPNGKRVIVCRTNDDDTVETTVKEYMEDKDGVIWLVPRSSNPAFQAPFRCDEPGPGVVDIRVTAIVVASLRLE